MYRKAAETSSSRKGPVCRCCMAVVERNRVVRCWVKSATSATPVACCTTHARLPSSEEGGDDVKSAWPLRPGLHTRYNGRYNGLPNREVEPIP